MKKDSRSVAVVALGGNALLPRDESPDAARQLRSAREAARKLAAAVGEHRLVVTHGNGPQVGLLALMNDADDEVAPYPLDVLDAESEGKIGYVVEMEIDNATDRCHTVALITGVVVDESDPEWTRATRPSIPHPTSCALTTSPTARWVQRSKPPVAWSMKPVAGPQSELSTTFPICWTGRPEPK